MLTDYILKSICTYDYKLIFVICFKEARTNLIVYTIFVPLKLNGCKFSSFDVHSLIFIQIRSDDNSSEFYMKSSELFESEVYLEEIADVLCIAQAGIDTVLYYIPYVQKRSLLVKLSLSSRLVSSQSITN